MYPDLFFQTFRQKLKHEWKFAFVTAFTAGLLIHMYRLTNHLLTWDSVYNFHSSQNTIHLGRCFLTLTCGIGSYYDLQWINGLLSLLYLGLTCACLTGLFSLRTKTGIFLTSILTVSFPVVASTFAYMYTADGYFLAQLLFTLAVLLTVHYKKGWIPAILCIALGYGSYQAYISYAVMLILTWTLLQLIRNELSVRTILSYWRRFLLMGGLGTAFYLLCNKLLSAVWGITASDYNGIATMALPDAAGFLLAVKNCLIEFAYFFFGPLDRINLFKLLNVVLFLLLAGLFLWIIPRSALHKRPAALLLAVLCLFFMPFACTMIYFLTPEVRYYMLMYAGFCPLYLLPVLLSEFLLSPSPLPGENESRKKQNLSLFFVWFSVGFTALTAFDFVLIDNISYLYMTKSNEMTMQLIARMTDRIEQTPGFASATKLCVIGHFADYDTISLNLPPAMAGIRDSYLISEQAHFAAAMDTYFGLSLANCSESEQQQIGDSKVFRAMECWPHPSSVRIEDDTIIIKIAPPQG